MEITGAITQVPGRPRTMHCPSCSICLAGAERALFGRICQLATAALDASDDLAMSLKMLQRAVARADWDVVDERTGDLWQTWSKIRATFAQLRDGHVPDIDDQYHLPLTAA